jgi:hypothetical protein
MRGKETRLSSGANPFAPGVHLGATDHSGVAGDLAAQILLDLPPRPAQHFPSDR